MARSPGTAANQRGYRADVQMFPQGAYNAKAPDARPTARIQLVKDASVRPDPLFAQVFKRHTNRSPYEARAPRADALAAIRAGTAGFPVQADFSDPAQAARVQAHRDLAMAAWRTELVTPRTLLESYKVLRVGPREIARYRDGIALNDPMVRAFATVGLFDRSQPSAPDSSAIEGQLERFNETMAATPAFFWMVTPDNERTTQLLAGRAYVRAQLAATAHGLSMHPLQQALQEYPEQAGHYLAERRLLGVSQPAQTVQMWARLGYGPSVGPAPRRGLEAHLKKA